MANFFWADGQSIMDYACFGDAVSFDTTFQTNKFEMPFAPFVGSNHHKQTIIFGAALIFNETIDSFVWLFQTFLTAMSGKHPSTIFTDQDATMAGAIAYVFRNTSHRLCLWHIYLNAAKHLGHVIQKHPDGSVLTYMVTHMQSIHGATVIFNTVDMDITCSCRKFESIGISRKATSLALKCSVSKELLVWLEKAIDNLDSEADNSLSKEQEKTDEVPLVSTNCDTDTLKGSISFRIPHVVKSSKNKQIQSVLEKSTKKKKKSAKKKGKAPVDVVENTDGADPDHLIGLQPVAIEQSSTISHPLIQEGYANATMPDFHMYGNSSTMDTPYIQGGYTGLLLVVDEAATMHSTARKLHFSGVPNHENK